MPITAKSTRLTFDDAADDVIADYTINKRKSKADLERRIALHLNKTGAWFERYNITSGNDIRAGLSAVGTNRGDTKGTASSKPA